MKKISPSFQWNKVTPLSKYLAMALFIVLPFITFMVGAKYQRLLTFEYKSTGNNIPSLNDQKTENDNDLTGYFYIGGRAYQLIQRIFPDTEKTYYLLIDHNTKKEIVLFEEGVVEAQIVNVTHSEDNSKWFISRSGSGSSLVMGVNLSKDESQLSPIKGQAIDMKDPKGYISKVIAWVGTDTVLGKICPIQNECNSQTQRYWTAPLTNLGQRNSVEF
jgi:hypothetical protein